MSTSCLPSCPTCHPTTLRCDSSNATVTGTRNGASRERSRVRQGERSSAPLPLSERLYVETLQRRLDHAEQRNEFLQTAMTQATADRDMYRRAVTNHAGAGKRYRLALEEIRRGTAQPWLVASRALGVSAT